MSLLRVSVSADDKRAAGIVVAAAASIAACGTCCCLGQMPCQPGATPPTSSFLADFLAGGISGCIAKICTAPVEQRKLQQQLAGVTAESGGSEAPLAGRWAGNAVNCARYFPTQACNFAFKDRIKALLPRADRRKEFGKFFTINMISGGLAGAISLCFVYPLDAARTLLALDAHGVFGGSSWNCLTTVVAAKRRCSLELGLLRPLPLLALRPRSSALLLLRLRHLPGRRCGRG